LVLYDSPLDFKIVFSSFKASTGKNLVNVKKSVRKIPRVPMKTPTSVAVGINSPQEDGR
jgi:hypothetical protein